MTCSSLRISGRCAIMRLNCTYRCPWTVCLNYILVLYLCYIVLLRLLWNWRVLSIRFIECFIVNVWWNSIKSHWKNKVILKHWTIMLLTLILIEIRQESIMFIRIIKSTCCRTWTCCKTIILSLIVWLLRIYYIGHSCRSNETCICHSVRWLAIINEWDILSSWRLIRRNSRLLFRFVNSK